MRATLQLMVACNDEALKQHLASTGRNATYINVHVRVLLLVQGTY